MAMVRGDLVSFYIFIFDNLTDSQEKLLERQSDFHSFVVIGKEAQEASQDHPGSSDRTTEQHPTSTSNDEGDDDVVEESVPRPTFPFFHNHKFYSFIMRIRNRMAQELGGR